MVPCYFIFVLFVLVIRLNNIVFRMDHNRWSNLGQIRDMSHKPLTYPPIHSQILKFGKMCEQMLMTNLKLWFGNCITQQNVSYICDVIFFDNLKWRKPNLVQVISFLVHKIFRLFLSTSDRESPWRHVITKLKIKIYMVFNITRTSLLVQKILTGGKKNTFFKIRKFGN